MYDRQYEKLFGQNYTFCITIPTTLLHVHINPLLSHSSYHTVLSFQVNGFYGARGVMGNIPDAYTYIASSFYHLVKYYNMQHRIRLYEYYRNQWTYHVKGLWYYLPNQTLPFLSMMGSSNFGELFLQCRLNLRVLLDSKTSLKKKIKI